MFDIREELKLVPKSPGVYLMKNSLGEIIYVGKSKRLKDRLSQYFNSKRSHSPKVKLMVKNIETFEYIVTDTELEALVLESNLIKKYRPKYNILLRDDKQYPMISINLKEKYPRIKKVRNKKRDGARYFGPYTNIMALNETLEVIAEIYPIRTCNLNLNYKNNIKRPCLNYYIDRCKGPCCVDVDEDEYMEMIQEIIMFLNGTSKKLFEIIEERMNKAAEELDFEKAAMYRDRLEALKVVRERQKIIYNAEDNQDIIGIARGIDETSVQVFFIRNGKINGREDYMIDNTEGMSKNEIISSFVKQYYLTASHIPSEILTEEDLKDKELIENWLSEKRGFKVKLRVPIKGDKNDLMEMVKRNAFEELKRNETKIKEKTPSHIKGLNELKEILGLDKYLKRIEAYDISNTQGINSVGSMVVFIDGKESKKDYRKFKIKYVKGPDDYSSLAEVLERRFRRGLKEIEDLKKKDLKIENFSVFPELIIMDGGKGQVNIAKRVLNKLNLNIPVCGLVKDDYHRTRGIIYENEELNIKERTSLFRLVSRIQDEAHRFAISYHRELINKNMIKSVLDTIPMIGEVRKKNLLKKFGSVEKIKLANIEELKNTPGMNLKAAEQVYDFFNEKGEKSV
ncbi:MAG: excinuclease ABC subunit UvrC [Andreesenia angusta]|nr:excinuclease ABC subunit UvrC [Andreesenia angusta]